MKAKELESISNLTTNYLNNGDLPFKYVNEAYRVDISVIDTLVHEIDFNSNYVHKDMYSATDLHRMIVALLYNSRDIPRASTVLIKIPAEQSNKYKDYFEIAYLLNSYGIFIVNDYVSAFGDEDTKDLDYEWFMFVDKLDSVENFDQLKKNYKKTYGIKSLKDPSEIYCSSLYEYEDIKRVEEMLATLPIPTKLMFICPHYDMYEERSRVAQLQNSLAEDNGELLILTLKDLIFKEGALFPLSLMDYYEVSSVYLNKLLDINNNILLRVNSTEDDSEKLDLSESLHLYDDNRTSNSIKILYATLAMYSVLSGKKVVVEKYEKLFNDLLAIANNLDVLPLYYRLKNKKFDPYMFMYAVNTKLCKPVKLENIRQSLSLKEFKFNDIISSYYRDEIAKPDVLIRNIDDIEIINSIDFILEESVRYKNVTLTGNDILTKSDYPEIDTLVKLIVGAMSQYTENFEDIVSLKNIVFYKVKEDNDLRIAVADYRCSFKMTGYSTSVISSKKGNLLSYITDMTLSNTNTLYRLNTFYDYKELFESYDLIDADFNSCIEPISYDEETIKLFFNYIICLFSNKRSYSVFGYDTPRAYLLGKLFADDSDFKNFLLPILKTYTSLKHVYKTGLVDAYRHVQALGKGGKIVVDERFLGSMYSLGKQFK